MNDLGPCKVWAGACHPQGYGMVYRGGKQRYAHREAWEAAHGPIPPGMVIRHKCDNPPCVEVRHLELGSQADNMRDKKARGRNASPRGEAHGMSRLTPADVVAIRADTRPLAEIARQFGVTTAHICNIRHHKKWAHIKDAP